MTSTRNQTMVRFGSLTGSAAPFLRSLGCAILSVLLAGAVRCEEAQPALRGAAEFGSISTDVSNLKPYLISACRGRGFQCVLVHIKNNGSNIVSIDGDHVKASVAGSLIEPQSEKQITRSSCCNMSIPATVTLAVVGVGSLGLAGPILFEMLTNTRQHHFYDSGFGFGGDGVRHEIEGARFGKRLLLQGDETSGWFCFQGSNLAGQASLQIPVSSGTTNGIIEVKIELPAGAPAKQTPDRRL